jgi:hypothetical protein
MGRYCEADGFYRKKLGVGGSVVSPEPILSDEVWCEVCNTEAERIKKVRGSRSYMTDRGRLNVSWCDVTIECPICKRTGTIMENWKEEDGNYYSNEERRVYRLY